jgi:hypothetical protein
MNFPGGKMNFKAALVLATILSTLSIAQSADLIYKGAAPKIGAVKEMTVDKDMPSYGREEISYYLRAEAGVRTVNEAINLKTQGLQYVRDIYDFEYLTSCPFPNPSDAYKTAVGDFIVRFVGNYVYSAYDFNMLRVLESRVPTVNQAMAVKSVGLRVRMQISDYLQLIPPSVGNPSAAYVKAISSFTAQNISAVLDYYSQIYLIVEAEKFTTTVGDAMMVKNAGLVSVHNREELFQLAAYSVPNPSPAYQQAVNNFIRDNLNRYPY